MAFIQKDMRTILSHYAGFGYVIFYLFRQNKICKEDIVPIFLKLDPEKSDLYLERILSQVDSDDFDKARLYATSHYSSDFCMKDYFGVSSSKLVLRNDVYETALNFIYTSNMIECLKSEDQQVERVLDRYSSLLHELVEETKESVVSRRREVSLTKGVTV